LQAFVRVFNLDSSLRSLALRHLGFHQVTLEIGQSARPDLPQLYPNNLTNPVQKCPTWHKITPDLHHQKRLKWGF
jgi:hypothetical protein